MNFKTTMVSISAGALLAMQAGSGTVTAAKVTADEVLTKEIGMSPPKAPEVLYYSFGTDGGSSVSDDSGNGCEGVAGGDAAWVQGGPFAGGAYCFDGYNDYVDAGSAPDFPSWASYSVSIWFLHDGGGDFGPGYGHKILDKTSRYHDWYISLSPGNGSVGFFIYENGSASGLGCSATNFMDSAWHHAVVTRDGTHGEFWLDGALVSTNDSMFSVYSASNLAVGYSFSTDNYQRKSWSGMIDEVRIFDRVVTSNEVLRLFTEGSVAGTNQPPPAAVLVSTNLAVSGGLSVTGQVSFTSGVVYSLPLGDLSCGGYTNAPAN